MKRLLSETLFMESDFWNSPEGQKLSAERTAEFLRFKDNLVDELQAELSGWEVENIALTPSAEDEFHFEISNKISSLWVMFSLRGYEMANGSINLEIFHAVVPRNNMEYEHEVFNVKKQPYEQYIPKVIGWIKSVYEKNVQDARGLVVGGLDEAFNTVRKVRDSAIKELNRKKELVNGAILLIKDTMQEIQPDFFLSREDTPKHPKPGRRYTTSLEWTKKENDTTTFLYADVLFDANSEMALVQVDKTVGVGDDRRVVGQSVERQKIDLDNFDIDRFSVAINTAVAKANAQHRQPSVKKESMMVGDQEQSVTGAPNFSKMNMFGNGQGNMVPTLKGGIRQRLFNPNTNPSECEDGEDPNFMVPVYGEGVHPIEGPVNTDDTWGSEVIHSEDEYELLPEGTVLDEALLEQIGEDLDSSAHVLQDALEAPPYNWRLTYHKPSMDKETGEAIQLYLEFKKRAMEIQFKMYHDKKGNLKLFALALQKKHARDKGDGEEIGSSVLTYPAGMIKQDDVQELLKTIKTKVWG